MFSNILNTQTVYRNANLKIILQIAEAFNLPFLEISCKNNINIDASFLILARKISEYRENMVGTSYYNKL